MGPFSFRCITALLVAHISSECYQALGFWGHGRILSSRSSAVILPYGDTKLFSSTTSLAMPHSLPRDGYKEGPPDSGEDAQKSLEPLEGKNPIVMTMEELQAKWIDICIEQSRPQDMDAFSLLNVLPLVVRENEFVVLVNSTADAIEKTTVADASSVLFITEQELQRMWQKTSLGPMGKNAGAFDAKFALLLINDEEDELLIGSGESEIAGSLLPLAQNLKSEIEAFDAASFESEESDDGIEYTITANELRRIWDERSEVPWGMPGKDFDEKLALLQVDDDDDDDETEYVSALYHNAEEEEALGFWNAYEGEENEELRETLKSVHDDLDDMTYLRPAWKKDRHILTPDIDTQEFMGDLMWSNTYMTQRIPANWNDPEAGEMSDTYHSASTMAWPGEEETDFNFKPPAWEILGIPISKNMDLAVSESVPALENTDKDKGPMDWNAFDFSKDESFNSANDAIAQEALDVDTFFKNIDGSGGLEVAVGVSQGEDIVEATPMTRNSDLSTTISRGWITPKHWTVADEFLDHVGYESWSNYPEEEFNLADDSKWEEDQWMEDSMVHVQTVTDMYLTDHSGKSIVNDERKFWERKMNKILGGQEDCEKEDIPSFLTPDADRGVKYSDELIEMKGKLTLHMAQDPPHIMYANDTFVHNTEFETMNKIGTIRDQYEWQPRGDASTWLIEKEKLAKVQPLVDFINHAGELKSTKNNVVVFDYKGLMRHIPGIRMMMLKLSEDCFPDMADLRIETDRTSDKFDR